MDGCGSALSQYSHLLLEQHLVVQLTAALTGQTWSISGIKYNVILSRVCESYGVRALQLSQTDVLHRSLEGAQAVAELIFTGLTEAEVPDVAQVGHPGHKQSRGFCST